MERRTWQSEVPRVCAHEFALGSRSHLALGVLVDCSCQKSTLRRKPSASKSGSCETPAFPPSANLDASVLSAKQRASMENSGETEDAKPKKRARSALRPGPKERAAAQQAAKEEETAVAAAAAAAAKPSGGKRAKAPKAEKPAHEVFVANLPFEVTEERLRGLFGGEAGAGVLAIKWLEHKDSHKFKGSAFLSLATRELAEAAVALNGTDADGRPLRVDWAAGGSAAVYVGNLPKVVEVNELKAAFAEAVADSGSVLAVWGAKKGKRYVKFSSAAAAQAALAKDGDDFGGRPMRVLIWEQPALQ